MAKILVISNSENPNSAHSLEEFKSYFVDFSFGLNAWNEIKIAYDAFNDVDIFDCIVVFKLPVQRIASFYQESDAQNKKIPLLFCLDSGHPLEINEFEKFSLYDVIFENCKNSELTFRINRLINSNSAKKNVLSGQSGIENNEITNEETPVTNHVIDKMFYNESRFGFLINDEPVDLTFKEFEVLDFLIKNSRDVFSREQIINHLWQSETANSRLIDVHIRRIRSKLGPHYSQYLRSMRSVGYCWG